MSISAKRQYYLQELGIRPWILRETIAKPSRYALMIVGHCPPALQLQSKISTLLDKMIAVLALPPESIYMSYLIQAHTDSEIKTQEAMLSELHLVSPKCILALGELAGHFLTQSSASMFDMRVAQKLYHDIPMRVSYDPAHLLLNPADKKHALIDLWRMKQCL